MVVDGKVFMSQGVGELRIIQGQELRDGMVLPGDLCDRKGRVLLRRGSVLNQQDLDRLEKRTFYGGDVEPKDKEKMPRSKL